MAAPRIEDIVGLDLVAAAMTPARREHFYHQLGSGISRPIIPAGLAPFLTLPGPEPRTLTRARMAAEIARAVSSNGCVTEDDLRGFTREEIADLFTEARRISGVAEMIV